MIVKYQPFRIKYNKLHPICTMVYDTKDAAIEYARSRDLEDKEIHIEEVVYIEEYKREFGDDDE